MIRCPEPELMDDEAQADAYAGADLSELQQAMVGHFTARCGALRGGRVLDLGCGSGDIAIRFASAFPAITVVGIDGSAPLLRHARRAVAAAGLDGRVRLEERRIPDESIAAGTFDAVVANSLLHHLEDPATLWRTAIRCARRGAPVMVMDLRRPANHGEAARLVAAHAGEAHPILQRDFLHSLRAAYTAGEIRQQLDAAGLAAFHVEEVGDLHVLVWGAVGDP